MCFANIENLYRFLAGACATRECHNAIRTYFYQILDAVDPPMNNPQRGVRQNGVVCLIKYVQNICETHCEISDYLFSKCLISKIL
jgi:hypothetical protein